MSLDEARDCPEARDCSEVLADLWLLLDHECPETHAQALQSHLEGCGHCLEQYDLEQHVKALLARKCGGEHAPEELRRRLRVRIQQTFVEADGTS